MQILFLPGLELVKMSKSLFDATEPFGVGYFAAITRFHSQVMMKHFVINDRGNDILGNIAPVQHRINPDDPGSFGIARQLDRVLSANEPSGSPGYLTVHFVGKIFLIDLVEKFLEIEVASLMTKNGSPRFGRCFFDFVMVRGNKISQQGGWFPVPAGDKKGQ